MPSCVKFSVVQLFGKIGGGNRKNSSGGLNEDEIAYTSGNAINVPIVANRRKSPIVPAIERCCFFGAANWFFLLFLNTVLFPLSYHFSSLKINCFEMTINANKITATQHA